MSPRPAKAVRGRVGDDPAAALRTHLIEVAVALLGERPLAAITTREIARAAGVSDGVLYNYFTDKNELLLLALVRRFHPIVARSDTGLPQPGTGTVEANLCQYAEAALTLMVDAVPMASGLISDPVLFHRFLAAIHTEPIAATTMPVTGYLRGEQELGRIGDADIMAITTLLVGAMLSLTLGGLMRGLPTSELVAEIPPVIALITPALVPTGT
ncbi:TetR/AcrR family transcriptional regulator [Pengzhenrongella frigida]|uniref:TetR/AcrR family transcriptional regulator n=1 Tax=Pengzhenrongella frigida TaxID=1259133 RepID=A0A4V1ZGS4_9MICO|nr:TetR/AcrR family transcriptional regulator [Cellulomonas sp. HLT2-17]RYV49554.1 TetR/AcrR family transcriptional regulator [Cellulomonas sp. HLT2-17]